MAGLLETCGQGGIADAAHQEAYDSSFLIADPRRAFVLETAGSDYAVAPFAHGRGHLQPTHARHRMDAGLRGPDARVTTSTASATTTRTRRTPTFAWRRAGVSSPRPIPAG